MFVLYYRYLVHAMSTLHMLLAMLLVVQYQYNTMVKGQGGGSG